MGFRHVKKPLVKNSSSSSSSAAAAAAASSSSSSSQSSSLSSAKYPGGNPVIKNPFRCFQCGSKEKPTDFESYSELVFHAKDCTQSNYFVMTPSYVSKDLVIKVKKNIK